MDKIFLLHEHYKETCSIVGEAVKKRDRFMVYVILALALFSFEALFPSTTSQAVGQFISTKFGLSLQFNLSLIGSVIWFFLLMFTLRYFQTAVFVERQYKYLYTTEDSLNKELQDDLIIREGKGYLAGYPLFSKWMWFLYTVAFPVLLLGIVTLKIVFEWIAVKGVLGKALSLDTLFAVGLIVSIVLYLHMIHSKPNGKKQSHGKE